MTPHDLVVGRWGARFLGRHLSCAIGRGGFIQHKREGDGGTPTQAMHLLGGYYRADRGPRPMAPFEMRAISPADVWSDDVTDPAYNHGHRHGSYPFSHERMWRGDPLYDVVLFTDYNYPQARVGAGSAIFVHQWRKNRHPTEGCIAFSAQNLRWILRHWQPSSRIILKP